MKIISFYLPQFHATPENDKWWGNGFTEWVNVKKGKVFIDGQYQPRVPLDRNYYDLTFPNVQLWQIDLAKKYGIYGFCFYHYWFDGKLLLEKPVEQFRDNPDINFPYCLCWANEDWTNAWVSDDVKILMHQKYGGKDEWKKHFEYLLTFFKEKNYIKNNGRPLFIVYKPEIINCCNEMLDYWQELALAEGFPGIDFGYQQGGLDTVPGADNTRFTFDIEYQPGYAMRAVDAKRGKYSNSFLPLRKCKRAVTQFLDTFFSFNFSMRLNDFRTEKLRTYAYDALWTNIISCAPTNAKAIPGAFVDWDNTARRKERGSVVLGATPSKFQKYLESQIVHARKTYKSDMIFMFAWNEWAECGYLEPDKQFGYGYLEAVQRALENTNEFPEF